ncbi:hypothetical protein ABH927_003152 [Planotetraspora sp. GP83]
MVKEISQKDDRAAVRATHVEPRGPYGGADSLPNSGLRAAANRSLGSPRNRPSTETTPIH